MEIIALLNVFKNAQEKHIALLMILSEDVYNFVLKEFIK